MHGIDRLGTDRLGTALGGPKYLLKGLVRRPEDVASRGWMMIRYLHEERSVDRRAAWIERVLRWAGSFDGVALRSG